MLMSFHLRKSVAVLLTQYGQKQHVVTLLVKAWLANPFLRLTLGYIYLTSTLPSPDEFQNRLPLNLGSKSPLVMCPLAYKGVVVKTAVYLSTPALPHQKSQTDKSPLRLLTKWFSLHQKPLELTTHHPPVAQY